jgi:flagellar protein FliL
MSKEKKQEDGGARKGGKLKLIIGAVALLAAGGGGVYGMVAAGMLGGGSAGEHVPDVPKLVAKGAEDPYAPAKTEKDGAIPEVDGAGGSEYRTSYFSFDEPFTANLKNSSGLIQVSLAAATRYDGRVLMWLDKHKLAVRSAILVELSDTTEEQVYTPEGKEALQARLTKSINKVLTDQEGFGGIDSVYFRSFLIQ